MFEYWPNFGQRFYKDVIKLFFIFPDGFRQNFYSMCQIDAKQCAECFLLVAHAVHELSRKFGMEM